MIKSGKIAEAVSGVRFVFGKDWTVNGKPNPFQHLRHYAIGAILSLGFATTGGVICTVLALFGLISNETGESMYMVCRVFFMVGMILGMVWNFGVHKVQEKHRLEQAEKE